MNRIEKNRALCFSALFLGLSFITTAQSWSVDDCMRYTVSHHPKNEKQRLVEEDVRKDLLESKLRFLPSINAGSSLSVNFGRSIDPATNIYNNTSNLSNNYSISGGMALFDGLYTINRHQIAKIIQQREEQVSRQVEANVSIETMQAYYQVLFAEAALQIGRETAAENCKRYDKGQKELEVGLRNISETAQLKSNLVRAEYNVIVQEADYLKSMLDLKQKMFYPQGKLLTLDPINQDLLTIPLEKAVDSSLIITQAIAFLPDIHLQDHAVRIASLEHKTAVGNLFPQLSLNGGISSSYSRFLIGGKDNNTPPFAKQFNDRLGEYIGLSLSIPIFDSFSRRIQIKRKKNDLIRAKIDRENTIRSLEKSITESIVDLDCLKKQCELSDENLQSSSLAYRTTEAKYDEGLVGVVDLLTVQTQFFTAKIDRLKAYLNLVMQLRIINYYQGKPLIQNP